MGQTHSKYFFFTVRTRHDNLASGNRIHKKRLNICLMNLFFFYSNIREEASLHFSGVQ